MAINKRISYIFHNPANTDKYWQGYEEDFDNGVISVSDKIAEQVDLRTVGKNSDFIKFIMIFDL